jgi:hypothetical protein
MQDPDILVTIDELAHEEHRLREAEGRGDLDDRDKERLSSIEVQLDQCWDLLRQRRARRGAGLDPDEADVRSTDTVEHYRQ